jgi:hypothetical protein
MNIYHCPISSVERELFVKAILIMKNITGFINWKSWSPEILSINFSFFNLKKLFYKYPLITTKR